MKMRSSNVLRKLRAGETVNCVKLNFSDPRAYEIAALSGFDCLWACQEHTAVDYRQLQEQILAAKAHDCDLVCRGPRGSYSDYVRPLELDATGIMVPHVMNAADAAQIIRMTRFQPVGRRPVDGGNADGAYCMIPFVEYLEQANRERFIILQIEDYEAMDELDEIAAVKGYDILFFGPGDFSHSLGIPGQFNDPKIRDARLKIAEAARKHGKFAGTVGSIENHLELIAMGYQFINTVADVVTWGNWCRKTVAAWHNKS
ncbi:MAG: aldolase/citrate lyase family protein [Victivallaceae bacterium]|nr:aldolase/citrate lyase family protein [Victivallaceae bacterium]